MGGYAATRVNPAVPLWVKAAVLASAPILCAASAYSSLSLARRAEGRIGVPAGVPELEVSDMDASSLPGA